MHAATPNDEDYLIFDAHLEPGNNTETALFINAKYNKACKSTPREKVVEKA
jgi:predicted Holliday junction resolvase-like endonuclease